MELLTTFIAPFVAELAGTTIEKFKESSKLKTLKIVLRERLLRELNYNIELINILGKSNSNYIFELNVEVIQEIFIQPIPISILFGDPVSAESKLVISGKRLKNEKFSRWIASIDSEADLIERIYQRIMIARLKKENQNSKFDNIYVKRLINGLQNSLKSKI